MSAQPIGPGSIVVCTSAKQMLSDFPPPGYRLTVGALYCVEAIRPWGDRCPVDDCHEGFVLKGRAMRGISMRGIGPVILGYCPSQFRPLNDGDTSLVENEATDTDGSGLQTYRVLVVL